MSGWDSLSQTEVLMALEDRFGVALPIERAASAYSIEELAQLVAEACAQQHPSPEPETPSGKVEPFLPGSPVQPPTPRRAAA